MEFRRTPKEIREKLSRMFRGKRVEIDPKVSPQALNFLNSTNEESDKAYESPEITSVRLEKVWTKGRHDSSGFVLAWEARNIGFGQIDFSFHGDGTIHVDQCGMDEIFCTQVLLKVLRLAEFKQIDWSKAKRRFGPSKAQ